MDIKKWVQDSASVGYSSLANSVSAASAGLGYISQWVGSLRIFGSTRINYNACKTHDERHYFLIPDNTSEDGYALSIVRCLPEGVPAVNELPKLRVIHLPNEHAEPMLRSLLVEQAKLDELAKPKLGTTVSDRLGEIADKIDELDGKIFGGVLLIGGLVAVFNPLLGAAIAAKSLIPSLGLFASKHGLKWG